jgi:HEAT repeat protein
MIVVAACAVGLVAYREYADRGLFYQIVRLRFGHSEARIDAALGLGLMGPRASIATGALTGALNDPDPSVRTQAAYALVRLGSRSPRLLPVLVAGIERTPPPRGSSPELPVSAYFDDPPKGWPLSDGGLYRNDPIEALKRVRPDAADIVPMLRKALEDPKDWVRRAAREVLFDVATRSGPSSPELADVLLAVLADDRFDPRRQDIAGYDQFEARKRAVEALAKRDRAAQARAVGQLAGDLRDVGSPRSYEAALLLPRLEGGTPAAAAVLRDEVRDDDEVKRFIALVLLVSLGEQAASAAPALLRVIAERDADRNIHLFLPMSWWNSLIGREAHDPSHRRFINSMQLGSTSAIALSVRALESMGEAVERRAVRELIAMVREPAQDDVRKRGAILALGEFGPAAADAVPTLAGVIRAREQARRGPSPAEDDNGSQATLATEALGKIGSDGDPEAVAILGVLLEAEDGAIASNAAAALRHLGPNAKPAIPALVKGLKSRHQGVRFSSSEALAQIGGPEVLAVKPALVAALDDEDRWVRIHAAEALGGMGAAAREAVPKMVRLLWEYGPDHEMAKSLGRIGPGAATAVPPLLAFLDGADGPTRDEIQAALDQIMPRVEGATIADSIAALKASDTDERSCAIYELGRLVEGSPRPGEGMVALTRTLDDPDPAVRRMATAVLGHLARRATIAGLALARAARDPDESVRMLAIPGLGRAGASPVLAGMLKDPSDEVRLRAADGLGRLGPRAAKAAPAMIAALEGQGTRTRAAMLSALGRIGAKDAAAFPTLLASLDDPAAEIRQAAARALGGLVGSHRDAVLPALLKAMNDPSWNVRLWVGEGLGKVRPARIVLPRLIEALKGDRPNARKTAAGALGELCGARDRDPETTRRAAEALAVALADRDPDVRSSAIWALRLLGADARPAESALRATLNDPNRNVRDHASAALQAIAEDRTPR